MTTTIPMHDGTTRTVKLHEHFRTQNRDEYTSETLPASWVRDAIKEELDYFGEKVWEAVPIQDALKERDAKIIGSRWVICNKNDPSNPDIRARLVAQEINTHADTSFFAATPPLESKSMLSPNGSRKGLAAAQF